MMNAVDQEFPPDFSPRRNQPCFCNSGQKFRRCCGQTATHRPPPFGVTVIHDYVSATQCDAWVKTLDPMEFKAATTRVESGEGEVIDAVVDARVTEIIEKGIAESGLVDVVRGAWVETAAERGLSTVEWFERPRMLRYRPGGKYDAHADRENYDPETEIWHRVVDRDLSMLLYLSDDYEGGDLEFTKFEYRYKPRRGDLITFPSDLRYVHQVHPVTSGVRHSVVSWATVSGSYRLFDGPLEKEKVIWV